MKLLDEIVLQAAALAPIPPLRTPLKASFTLGGQEQSRLLQIGGPWMVCQTTPHMAGARWSDLCARLSERGLLLECSVAALEKLPVTAIPRRLFRQRVGMTLMLEELQSADVVEITCQSPTINIWGWPPEVDSREQMVGWLGTVRQVIGKNTPLGLGVKAGVDEASLEALVNWPIDFITLYSDGVMELLVDSLSSLRTKLKACNVPLPILVRTEIKQVDQLVKLVALGASAVTIDSYLYNLWQHSSQPSMGGFLATQMPSNTVGRSNSQIADQLELLNRGLMEAMETTRSSNPAELSTSLRAVTPTAARLGRIRLIGERLIGE